LRFATFAACFPSAVRVLFGSFDIVRLRLAAFAAFLMFRRAAALCLADAIKISPRKYNLLRFLQ
jgi:hypothetical protein